MNLYWKTKVTLSSLFLLGFAVNPVNKPIENIEETKNSLKESNSDNKKEYIQSLYSKASFTDSHLYKTQTFDLDNKAILNNFSEYDYSNKNFINNSDNYHSNSTSTWEIENTLLLSLLLSFLFLSKNLFSNVQYFKKFEKQSKFWNSQKFISLIYQIKKIKNSLLFENNIFQKKQFTFFTQIKHNTCS